MIRPKDIATKPSPRSYRNQPAAEDAAIVMMKTRSMMAAKLKNDFESMPSFSSNACTCSSAKRFSSSVFRALMPNSFAPRKIVIVVVMMT